MSDCSAGMICVVNIVHNVNMNVFDFMIEYNVTEICTALYCYVRVI